MSLPPGASDARRVGGGDINEAWRVTFADGGPAFVKTRADAGPGEYEAEAAALRWLAEPGALRTPRVIDLGEDYLALEWIEPGRLDEAGVEELGRGLAATHAAGAAGFGDPYLGGAGDGDFGVGREVPVAAGGGVPASFGSLSLPNEPTADWPSFYAERRLRPLVDLARERDALSDRGAARWSACADGSRSWRVRLSRRLVCTAICGAAT